MILTRLAIIALLLSFSIQSQAQVAVVSPRPAGILQVRGEHAHLRLTAHVPPSYGSFRYKISSDVDTSGPTQNWFAVNAVGGLVDTLILLPRSLRSYTVYWRADSSGVDTGGLIGNLTPGHIIGVAGQSNAAGGCWEMVAGAWGDIRMLRDLAHWQPAKEPTGSMGGGPWIVMANMLFQVLNDSLPIGIVNVAVPSSGIMGQTGPQWVRNPLSPEDTSIYGRALLRFLTAGSELECLAWIQGEADGFTLEDPEEYRMVFKGLMSNFAKDLNNHPTPATDTFQVFHLQISGNSSAGAPTNTVPQVREAHRMLPSSTLVGTAVGRSVEGDGLHFDVTTLWAVGKMFAGAILKERYGISSPMYPPLMPDTVARLDSILDGSIIGRYCFSLGWNRGGVSTKLRSVQPTQYFALYENGLAYDTSEVWYRISEDSTHVLTGLRHTAIDPSHQWQLTYDPIARANTAPLATIEPTSGDTIFATAFYKLPVNTTLAPASVKRVALESITTTHTQDGLNFTVVARDRQQASLSLWDDCGVCVRSRAITLEKGQQEVTITTVGLRSGRYWALLTTPESKVIEQAVVIR